MGRKVIYKEVAPEDRKLKRGGTLCACGQEKDRRSRKCWRCMNHPLKGQGTQVDEDCLRLYYVHGISMAKIAALYKVSYQRVYQRIKRARKAREAASLSESTAPSA